MHQKTYEKILFHLSLLGIVISILVGFFDVIFDHVTEMIHLALEVVEMGLDRLIEHLFETELRETQIIVFYLMLVFGGIVVYLFWKMTVLLLGGLARNFRIEWLEFKEAVISDWNAMSMISRIIWISGFLIINYLLSFLLF